MEGCADRVRPGSPGRPSTVRFSIRLKRRLAALPVPFRTSPQEPTFQSLTDPGCTCLPDGRSFPTGLDPFLCKSDKNLAAYRILH
jgi:hypothetical protein